MNINAIIGELSKRGYDVSYFDTASQCTEYLNKLIDNTTVGIGGSVTVGEMGLYPLLKKHNTVYWHGDPAQVQELGDSEIRHRAMNTELYICSVNAMTEQGVIINIDGTGNRIASMCYGHKKVYLIVGKNKIAPDFEKALMRARNTASPKNAQRLNMKTPCAEKGDKCYDCQGHDRICRGFLVMDRALAGIKTEVIIVNENLGY